MTGAPTFVLGTTACVLGLAAGVLAWRTGAGAWRARAEWAGRTALLLVATAWLDRWRLAGHMPVFGTYESALSLAVAVLAACGVVRSRGGPTLLWAWSSGIALALLLHGLAYDATVFPLTISERSHVVDVHALLAWGAFGGLTASAGLGAARLVGLAGSRAAALLPASLSWGFLLHTGMLASGSLYKFMLFGRAWSFDPIESLGFVAWIAYGSLLHQHLLAGWSGRRLAVWSLGLFVLLTVSYRGIVYFPSWSTYHILDMDLRLHVTPAGPSGGGEA